MNIKSMISLFLVEKMVQKQGFKETEIGKIPIEWDVEELKSIINIKRGFAFKDEFFTDKPDENVVLTPGNIHVGEGFKAHKFKYYLGEYPGKVQSDGQTNTQEVRVSSGPAEEGDRDHAGTGGVDI